MPLPQLERDGYRLAAGFAPMAHVRTAPRLLIRIALPWACTAQDNAEELAFTLCDTGALALHRRGVGLNASLAPLRGH